jgi:hypothetical protein
MKGRLTVNNPGCAAFDIRPARFGTAPDDYRDGHQREKTSAAFPIRRAAVDQPMPM